MNKKTLIEVIKALIEDQDAAGVGASLIGLFVNIPHSQITITNTRYSAEFPCPSCGTIEYDSGSLTNEVDILLMIETLFQIIEQE